MLNSQYFRSSIHIYFSDINPWLQPGPCIYVSTESLSMCEHRTTVNSRPASLHIDCCPMHGDDTAEEHSCVGNTRETHSYLQWNEFVLDEHILVLKHTIYTLYVIYKLGPCPSRGAPVNGLEFMSQGLQASERELHWRNMKVQIPTMIAKIGNYRAA